MGQWLCVPMILFGAYSIWRAPHRACRIDKMSLADALKSGFAAKGRSPSRIISRRARTPIAARPRCSARA